MLGIDYYGIVGYYIMYVRFSLLWDSWVIIIILIIIIIINIFIQGISNQENTVFH